VEIYQAIISSDKNNSGFINIFDDSTSSDEISSEIGMKPDFF